MKGLSKRQQTVLLGILLGAAVVILCASVLFVRNVSSSLWDSAVKNIMESTVQGTASLSTKFQRDQSILSIFADLQRDAPAANQRELAQRINEFARQHDFSYLCCIGPDGAGFSSLGQAVDTGSSALFSRIYAQPGGISDPVYDPISGRRAILIHTALPPPVGARGPWVIYGALFPDQLYGQYSLSFYQGEGFSYVVNSQGELILSSSHRGSDKAFSNLYHSLYADQNDPETLRSLAQSLRSGSTGYAVLQYRGEWTVLAYAPIEGVNDWRTVSIIPEAVIMRESNAVILQALLLCALIFLIFVLVAVYYVRRLGTYTRHIEKLANTDALTGERSLSRFKSDAVRLLASRDKTNYALCYIDIKNFKYVNDFFGYAAGDRLLLHTSRMLSQSMRGRELFARVSADTFAVLQHYAVKSELTERFRRLEQRVASLEEFMSQNYLIQLFSGIYCLEDGDITDVDSLLDRANIARQAAKAEGASHIVFYTEDLRQNIRRISEIESAMGAALENGEFVIYLQPKFDARTHHASCAEALVRWQHPQKGLIPPNDFIPIFEKNRFIVQLDAYVFDKVCRLLRGWIDRGQRALPISVNVSRMQLYTQDFVERYTAIKDRYRIPDQLIELEFTESVVFADTDMLHEVMSRFKASGFRCSLDDFGKGYSSLNLLKSLPVDVLKLDQLFFHESGDPQRDRVMIQSVVMMAKALHMSTVAEGVEHLEQVNFLRAIGCDLVQGYVFSPPIPLEQFEAEYIVSGAAPSPPRRPVAGVWPH